MKMSYNFPFSFWYRGHKDKIFEIKWDPNIADQFVTVGMKHIKFWTLSGGGFTSKRGTFGQQGKVETMLCASYSKTPGMIYSGAGNGRVYVWENGVLNQTVEAHKGPVFAVHCLEKVIHFHTHIMFGKSLLLQFLKDFSSLGIYSKASTLIIC